MTERRPATLIIRDRVSKPKLTTEQLERMDAAGRKRAAAQGLTHFNQDFDAEQAKSDARFQRQSGLSVSDLKILGFLPMSR